MCWVCASIGNAVEAPARLPARPPGRPGARPPANAITVLIFSAASAQHAPLLAPGMDRRRRLQTNKPTLEAPRTC